MKIRNKVAMWFRSKDILANEKRCFHRYYGNVRPGIITYFILNYVKRC